MIAGNGQNIRAQTYDEDEKKTAASIDIVTALGVRLDKLSSFRLKDTQIVYGNDDFLKSRVTAFQNEVRILEGAMSAKEACSKLAESVRENQKYDFLANSDVSGNEFKASNDKQKWCGRFF
uniref:Uncharacterized protein n=1 Tax=Aplanochytrium stocchinoi TaxID=215587 RepID=A0A7S3LKY3_9STRA|mmetsp:Transcript_1358/g.1745  ORF Transcript_1358/g.1745 Transcript_1358/m.1745 type:complete len:121 (-) Transcript_1358:453-815(-)